VVRAVSPVTSSDVILVVLRSIVINDVLPPNVMDSRSVVAAWIPVIAVMPVRLTVFHFAPSSSDVVNVVLPVKLTLVRAGKSESPV